MEGEKKNRILIAAAGSGKTWRLVSEALSRPGSKVLIATYTQANASEIEKQFHDRHGCVPAHVTISTWFSFMLEHGVRPYQGCMTDKRVAGLHFNQGMSALYTEDTHIRHYLDEEWEIYRDKVSKFACKCDELSNGRVVARIAGIFDEIFIDEVQDVAGYDLEFIESLMDSRIRMLLVGDPRQGTYSTHNSRKYGKFRKAGIINYFRMLEKQRPDVSVDETSLRVNRRCNQLLCDLSDALYPHFPQSTSSNDQSTQHDGVFLVRKPDIAAYVEGMKPMQLRYRRDTAIPNTAAIMNFGESKGLTFDRVLIYPTKDFVKWLRNRTTSLSEDVRAKSYVALTRARFSAAIVVDEETLIPDLPQWTQ